MPADRPIPVIDLFAGPGGLGEGFAALGRPEGTPRFMVRLSIEKDPTAHQTLELRAFFRQFPHGQAPMQYYQHIRGQLSRRELFDAFPDQACAARSQAWHKELADPADAEVRRRIRRALGGADNWVLIGGPPCQAYSLAGRSRNRGRKDYNPAADPRQFLYRNYLRILADHRPPVFVMENVKGLLSATLHNQRIFDRILHDLHSPVRGLHYRICSLVSDGMFADGELTDFVVRAERYDVPQARHRIILLGIRDDLRGVTPGRLRARPATVAAGKVLDGLPKLRSGLSNGHDGDDAWIECLRDAPNRRWFKGAARVAGAAVCDVIDRTVQELALPPHGRGREFIEHDIACQHRPEWFGPIRDNVEDCQLVLRQ